MTQQKTKKTAIGIELIRVLNQEGVRIFSIEQARNKAEKIGMNKNYVPEAIHHLNINGWIVPLKRGLYAISSSLPGVAPVHEFEVAMALVKEAAISHWSALHYHGLTDQVPRLVYVTTVAGNPVPQVRGENRKKSKGGYPVGDTVYRFVQIKRERFFGTEKVWVGDSRIQITDPERTLLDGLAKPRYCGDFGEVLHAFETRGDELDVDRIVEYALKLDTSVAKRLGWVLERLGAGQEAFAPLEALPARGHFRLDPSAPARGPANKRWMVQENLAGAFL